VSVGRHTCDTLCSCRVSPGAYLLAAAGLAVHSFWNLTHVDMGFRTDHILTFGLPLPYEPLKTRNTHRVYRRMTEGVQFCRGLRRLSVSTG